MNKIIENLHVFSAKIYQKTSLLIKIATTGILSTIIISLCGSNLAFAEIGGGTRTLATLATPQDR